MPGGGTTIFTDPGDYQAGFRGARINLVFTGRGDFTARLTWVELPDLQLLRCQESLPRIAHVSLKPERVVIAFPTHFDPPPIWSGVELQSGDIMFHSRGEHMHQWTCAPTRWAMISLAPAHLSRYGAALTGLDLVAPPVGRMLRPKASTTAHLQHLHAEACRLAETKPDILARREVARALEQDLLHALVNCLTADGTQDQADARRRRADVMVRFEAALAVHSGRPLHIADLCAAIGVSERTLRVCCAEFLGMSPSRYDRLRRLNLARAALRCVGPATASVAELALRHGFSERGRFAVLYRTMFGETPSTTLRHSRSSMRDAAPAEFA